MKKTIVLNYTSSTKRTHVFNETVAEGEAATFPTIYVQKSAIGDKAPASITVTIEANS
jgi:hypothetical protein